MKQNQDLLRLTNNNSDDYAEKNMNIKFNSVGNLSLKKTLKLYDIMIVVRRLRYEQNWRLA